MFSIVFDINFEDERLKCYKCGSTKLKQRAKRSDNREGFIRGREGNDKQTNAGVAGGKAEAGVYHSPQEERES